MKNGKQKSLSLDVLDTPVSINMSVNELRMIINCFNALEYQCKLDDEPYLTGEAFEMVERLRQTYSAIVREAEPFMEVQTG